MLASAPSAVVGRDRPRIAPPLPLRSDIDGLREVAAELGIKFMERYPCRVREVYGLTEATGLGTSNRRTETFRPGSAGSRRG